jgi:hypothetical protein
MIVLALLKSEVIEEFVQIVAVFVICLNAWTIVNLVTAL